jgi:hypothetical protein
MQELPILSGERRGKSRRWKLDEILRMPAKQRRQIQLCRPKRRKRYIHGKFTPEELIVYLKEKGFHSVRQLQKNSAPGEPRFCDYREAFGQWSVACEKAFGKQPSIEPEDIASYLIKCVVQFDLWTKEAWQRAHEFQPDIVPSERRVRTNYGKWSNLFVCARRYSLKLTMDEYLKLRRKLGRTPTDQECRDEGIDMQRARELFCGKAEFDKFMEDLIKVEPIRDARQTGNP